MKFLVYFILLFLFSLNTFSQSEKEINFSRVDSIISQFPDSLSGSASTIANYILSKFSTDDEKVRAVFYWVSNNIDYDLTRALEINLVENDDDLIKTTLNTKKGICADYALLFAELCRKVNIPSLVVEGYTQKLNALNASSHAWNVALINNTWYLFDPTWAAGYIRNKKFNKKYDDSYFKVKPEELIKTHMPYNYIFQLSHYPITHEEFSDGEKLESQLKTYVNFSDSIVEFKQFNRMGRNISEEKYLKDYSGKNTLIFLRLNEIRTYMELDRKNEYVSIYNASVTLYNDGIKAYNTFIKYRNNLFLPAKTDAEIQAMLTLVKKKFDSSKAELMTINSRDGKFDTAAKDQLIKVTQAQKLTKEQQDWLNIYFSKNPKERKTMFYAK